MGYNKENYRRIREKFQNKYLNAYAEADRRTAEVHAKSPELAALDRELSGTAAEIALAAIGTGEEYAAKLEAVKAKNLALQAKRAEILRALGYPADYTLPPYECAACRDTGFVGTKMCDCMRRELILAAYETSGLGALLRTQSFDNFDLSYYQSPEDLALMTQNFKILREYAESFTPQADSLLFYGATGLGKTHLSTALARRVIERGYDVCYTSAVNLFADFEYAKFGNNAFDEAGVTPARYRDCELLIIDDLGAETTNSFHLSCLYTVLNDRINLAKPFIVSTNLPPRVRETRPGVKRDDLETRYGDRIVSRLIGGCRAIRFSGKDVRIQKLVRASQ